ncbi:MAG: hypothetical protein JW963_04790 [Anaerolineales bacterium]|nr:hypothetical protein [Anaerolineales bacterium]
MRKSVTSYTEKSAARLAISHRRAFVLAQAGTGGTTPQDCRVNGGRRARENAEKQHLRSFRALGGVD